MHLKPTKFKESVGMENICGILSHALVMCLWFIQLCFHMCQCESVTENIAFGGTHTCLCALLLSVPLLFYEMKTTVQTPTQRHMCMWVHECKCWIHPSHLWQNTDWFVWGCTHGHKDKLKGSVCNKLPVVLPVSLCVLGKNRSAGLSKQFSLSRTIHAYVKTWWSWSQKRNHCWDCVVTQQ